MNGGAYRLVLRVGTALSQPVGTLGQCRFAAGTYIYVGSARRGLRSRVDRHLRLARDKAGRQHWHIDRLLLHRAVVMQRAELYPGGEECRLSARLAGAPGVSVPVPGFGASDCRAGCRAHLYRVDGRRRYRVGREGGEVIYCQAAVQASVI